MKKQKKKRQHLTSKNLRGVVPTKPRQLKFPFTPIIVLNDNTILDGMHRYQACKETNTPLQVIRLEYSSDDLLTPDFKEEFTALIAKQQKELDREMIACKVPADQQVAYSSSFFKVRKFYELRSKFKSENYWETLLEVYTTSDNNRFNQPQLKELFNSSEPGKEVLMTTEARELLSSLPEEVVIYRGMTVEEMQSGDFGISWTLDKKVAEKFIGSYWRNLDTNHIAERTVHSLKIKKTDIVCIETSRNEQEVIYLS